MKPFYSTSFLLSEGRARVRDRTDPEYKRTRGRKPGTGLSRFAKLVDRERKRVERTKKAEWRRHMLSKRPDNPHKRQADADSRAHMDTYNKFISLKRSKAPKHVIRKAERHLDVRSRIADFTSNMQFKHNVDNPKRNSNPVEIQRNRSIARRAASLAKRKRVASAVSRKIAASAASREIAALAAKNKKEMDVEDTRSKRPRAKLDMKPSTTRKSDDDKVQANISRRARLDMKLGTTRKSDDDKVWARRSRRAKLDMKEATWEAARALRWLCHLREVPVNS